MKMIIYLFMNTNKEVIMNDDKTKASAGIAENLQEALVLRPEWEIKPKSIDKSEVFSVFFNRKTDTLELMVNNEPYKSVKVRDSLEGQIKFHDALSHVVAKIELWRVNAKN